MAEQRFCKPQVPGPIPGGGSARFPSKFEKGPALALARGGVKPTARSASASEGCWRHAGAWGSGIVPREVSYGDVVGTFGLLAALGGLVFAFLARNEAADAADASRNTARMMGRNQLLLLIPTLEAQAQRIDRVALSATATVVELTELMNGWQSSAGKLHGLLDPDAAYNKLRSLLTQSIEGCVQSKEAIRSSADMAGATADTRKALWRAVEGLTKYSGRMLRDIEEGEG